MVEPSIKGAVAVLDNGYFTCKAGFSGEGVPRNVFREVISSDEKGVYIGDDAYFKELPSVCPIENGIVTDLPAMEKIWLHTFQQTLKVNPKGTGALVTLSPIVPKEVIDSVSQVFFDHLMVPLLSIYDPGVLALFSTGRTTGMCLDLGESGTRAIPVNKGKTNVSAVKTQDLAGRDLTKYLGELLKQSGVKFETKAELEILRDIKEKVCEVLVTYEEVMTEKSAALKPDKTYTLPDGKVLVIEGATRYNCPESLFRPFLIREGYLGIHELIKESLEKSEPTLRSELLQNIVVAGGSAQFPNLSERLTSELTSLHKTSDISVTPGNAYSTWVGGAIMASLGTYAGTSVTKKEYFEEGPSVVHRKLF